MATNIGIVLAIVAALVSFLVAFWVMRRAKRLGLLQHPNQRSSHSIPTPGGGGLGIVAGGTIAGLLMALVLPWLTIPVLMAGILIAAMGYWDDRRPIPARWRLGAQVLLMGSVIAVLPLDLLQTYIGIAWPEWLLIVVLVLASTLWINLFNFMDGIDGLAASEAIFLMLAAALLAFLAEPGFVDHPMFWWMIGLAAACFGFLLLNWPPARIFMGDAGSTYLGLMTAFFAAASLSGSWLTLPQWLILPALFLADSLTTLARRALLREPVWEAHRRHAYQVLQGRWGSHLRVTLLYAAINLVVVLPLAWLAGARPQWGWVIVALVYVVLVGAALLAGAGAPLQPEAQNERAGADNTQ